MAKKTTGLGVRGINAMLGAKQKSDNSSADLRVEKLPIDQLQPGEYQPRKQFEGDALQELADSIKIQGIVQPIVVRLISSNNYEIIAGERRWRAAKLAGLDVVPVLVRQADSQTTLAMALIENIQREDLNPIETAIGLKRLMQEFELTQQQVADAVGRSRAAVSNLLRLLKLPEDLQKVIHDELLTMGHARAIISLPKEIQRKLADKAIEKGWSVRDMEEAAQQVLLPKKIIRDAKKSAIPNIDKVLKNQDELAGRLSTKVKIAHKENGRGKIEIPYKNIEDLDRLMSLLKQ